MSDLEELARKLADYTRCLDPAQAICDRRTSAFIAERIAALKAQVANGKIGEDAAALTIRHLEALAEMIALGLHHGGEAEG